MEQLSDVLVVRPKRDIVASQVDDIRKELQSFIDGGHTCLAIDLAEVGIIDSKGLALLMMCHKSLAALGGRLTVVTGNEDFRYLFHLMRLDQHFSVVNAL